MNHGHVFPRVDGTKADCGGQRHCAVCASEQMALDTVLENPGAIDLVLQHAAANHQPAAFQTDEITVAGQQWTLAEARRMARSVPDQPQEPIQDYRSFIDGIITVMAQSHALEDKVLSTFLKASLAQFDEVAPILWPKQ